MAHRYWRAYITATQGQPGTNAASADEIELRATVGGADQVGVGTASASDNHASYPSANAFDGNTSTFWVTNNSSAIFPVWLKYDFGEDKQVQEWSVESRLGFPSECWKDFQLQYSDDNVNWTTVYTGTGVVWTSGETKTFSGWTDAEPEAIGGTDVTLSGSTAARVLGPVPAPLHVYDQRNEAEFRRAVTALLAELGQPVGVEVTVPSATSIAWNAITGKPEFFPADLADTTGILPVADGGTGLASTSARFAFIGPTGAAGAPTWRALTAADIGAGTFGAGAFVMPGALTLQSTLAVTSGVTFSAGLAITSPIVWGGDTNIYRSAANVLKTDDAMLIAGTLGVTSKISANQASGLSIETAGAIKIGGHGNTGVGLELYNYVAGDYAVVTTDLASLVIQADSGSGLGNVIVQSSQLTCGGALVAQSTLAVTGAASMSSTLAVTGAITQAGTNVAKVVVSTSAPSGSYPAGTLWAKIA